jgi:hypothetical protein
MTARDAIKQINDQCLNGRPLQSWHVATQRASYSGIWFLIGMFVLLAAIFLVMGI